MSCNLNVVAVGRLGWMLVRCSCSTVVDGVAVLDAVGLDVVALGTALVGIDFVGVGFGRVVLGGQEFFDLQLQLQQRFFCEAQLVCY